MLAMSLSTRSSTALNGSLHRTVRWAWSLSLRCTQSTVKSRRRSCALRMNSPRSRARVVCGGTDLARQIFRSVVTRGTATLEEVVEATVSPDVVVGEVELGDPRVPERQPVGGPVAVDELPLDDPV